MLRKALSKRPWRSTAVCVRRWPWCMATRSARWIPLTAARVTGGGITSYFYYAPWGLTSQGALYRCFSSAISCYGTTEEQLGAIAVAFRKHACLNPNAVMYGKPITIDDYMNAKYVAEPLRLYDYCLINDGGVAIIVRRADMAKDLKHKPVMVSGFGWSEENVDATQLRPRLKDFYHGASRRGAADVPDGRRDAQGRRCVCHLRQLQCAFARLARRFRLLQRRRGRRLRAARPHRNRWRVAVQHQRRAALRAICKAGTTSPNWCASCAGA